MIPHKCEQCERIYNLKRTSRRCPECGSKKFNEYEDGFLLEINGFYHLVDLNDYRDLDFLEKYVDELIVKTKQKELKNGSTSD